MLSILAVGRDVRLLATRAAVLRRTGAEVVEASPQLAYDLLIKKTFNVVVLCHTLEVKDVAGLLGVTQSDSGTRVVHIVANSASLPNHGDFTIDHVASALPSALVEKVLQLLHGVEQTNPALGSSRRDS
ncbi:hypothetical protein BH10ACI4_BH10ACI4_10070 [soil metagenome]